MKSEVKAEMPAGINAEETLRENSEQAKKEERARKYIDDGLDTEVTYAEQCAEQAQIEMAVVAVNRERLIDLMMNALTVSQRNAEESQRTLAVTQHALLLRIHYDGSPQAQHASILLASAGHLALTMGESLQLIGHLSMDMNLETIVDLRKQLKEGKLSVLDQPNIDVIESLMEQNGARNLESFTDPQLTVMLKDCLYNGALTEEAQKYFDDEFPWRYLDSSPPDETADASPFPAVIVKAPDEEQARTAAALAELGEEIPGRASWDC